MRLDKAKEFQFLVSTEDVMLLLFLLKRDDADMTHSGDLLPLLSLKGALSEYGLAFLQKCNDNNHNTILNNLNFYRIFHVQGVFIRKLLTFQQLKVNCLDTLEIKLTLHH